MLRFVRSCFQFCKLFQDFDGVRDLIIASLILVIQVVAAGANPIQIAKGIDRTTKALVSELKNMSKEVKITKFYVKFYL